MDFIIVLASNLNKSNSLNKTKVKHPPKSKLDAAKNFMSL